MLLVIFLQQEPNQIRVVFLFWAFILHAIVGYQHAMLEHAAREQQPNSFGSKPHVLAARRPPYARLQYGKIEQILEFLAQLLSSDA
jgi:hypothetical protein